MFGSFAELGAVWVGFFDNLCELLDRYAGNEANVAKGVLCAFFALLNSETYAIRGKRVLRKKSVSEVFS